MCGICGILRTGSSEIDAGGTLLDRMTDTIAHRGPDDRGTWSDGKVALGHRRLAVIDLSAAGHQPMSNEDGSLWLNYNGEIYNFRELKEKFRLAERGHVFRSRTDTEVLVHLYEELGPAMARELDGMFALALWDARRQSLVLMRDRFGIKPLFYQQDASFFRFGSEIKAILTDERVPRRVALQAMHDVLTYDYVPGPQTAFDGIYEVPPACTLTVDADGRTHLARYWSPPVNVDDAMTAEAAVAKARELLDRAVRKQLVADVPVGVLLSGGLDSSTLLAMMKRHTNEPIHTYSVGFDDPSFDESRYARLMAREFGTVHREVTFTADLLRRMLPEYLRWIEEPYADGSAIPTYYVCQLAKDEVVVLLSGEGGDEVFAGYDTHAAYRASQWFSRVPRWFRNGVMKPLIQRLPVSDKKLSLEFRMKRFLSGQDLPPWQAHLAWRIVLSEAQKLELYAPQVRQEFAPQQSDRFFEEIFARMEGQDDLNRILAIDSAVFLPDDLMIKNDRMSMAHSLEARVPMTDNELVDFLWSVPPRLKLPGLKKKFLMRQAMQGVVPPLIVNKKKVGMEIPYSRWLKHELYDVLMEYCGPAHIADCGLFRPEVVHRYIEEHRAGRFDHGRFLWGLLNFMMWLEMYIPSASVATRASADTLAERLPQASR